MSVSKNTTLALVSDPALQVKGDELTKLQEACVEQFKLVAGLHKEAAVRAILAGVSLFRVKASMKHGTFTPWCKVHLPFAKTSVHNYMRIAQVFLDKAKVQRPDLLALPGEQLSLPTEGNTTARRFMEKLAGFCGDLTLTELLIKHNIKAVGLKAELSTTDSDDTPPPGSAEDYFAEVATNVYGFRKLVTSRESLARLTPQQLTTLHQEVTTTYTEFQKLYAEATGKTAAITV